MKWTRITWPYNSDEPYASWECWMVKKNGYRVILHPGQWPDKGWSFVVSHTNPNADGSHSGFLPGLTNINDAKAELEKRMEPGYWP